MFISDCSKIQMSILEALSLYIAALWIFRVMAVQKYWSYILNLYSLLFSPIPLFCTFIPQTQLFAKRQKERTCSGGLLTSDVGATTSVSEPNNIKSTFQRYLDVLTKWMYLRPWDENCSKWMNKYFSPNQSRCLFSTWALHHLKLQQRWVEIHYGV